MVIADVANSVDRARTSAPDHTSGHIRKLVDADVEPVLAIWNAANLSGEHTHVAEALTLEQARATLFDVPKRFESYVHESSGRVAGWAALMRYHEREAYGATAELVAHVSANCRRQGIGRALVRHALARAPQLGFHTIVAILQPDPAYIVAWTARLGFRCTGQLKAVLPLGTEWRDILVFQRSVSMPQEGMS
jgi:L-amino acid N-acyltransferase YncA